MVAVVMEEEMMMIRVRGVEVYRSHEVYWDPDSWVCFLILVGDSLIHNQIDWDVILGSFHSAQGSKCWLNYCYTYIGSFRQC